MTEIEPEAEPQLNKEEVKILEETKKEYKPKSNGGIFGFLFDNLPYVIVVVLAIVMFYFKQEPEQMLSLESFDSP